MDKLAFRQVIVNNCNFGENVHAEIIINGIPFADIAKKHERIAAEKGTGDYKGFEYDYDFAETLYDALANNATRYDESEAQKPLMICNGCQEPGCWGLWVTIEDTDDRIVWRDVNNRSMASRSVGKTKWWVYDEFPVFCFDKTEYSTAIKELKLIADAGRDHRMERQRKREVQKSLRESPTTALT